MPAPWIDVSRPLRTGALCWPGDPPPEITRTVSGQGRELWTTSFLAMSAHSGTHVDAPAHVFPDGLTLDAMPFEASVGPARVIEITDPRSITPEELTGHRIRRGERLLFKTGNSERARTTDNFFEDFVHVSPAAARLLAERGVRLVGVDYLSVGAFREGGRETHEVLLGAGIWVLEGLDLSNAPPGRVDLVCLPLRIVGADGAPARAFVRERRR